MSFSLRPYQSAAIQGIYNYFQDESGNPLVVIPTAGGKSLVMATFVEGVLKAFPDQRILIVTHVRELIEQNFAELKKLWPQAPAGIYSAGLKKREIRAQILFAGIQSIHKRVYDVQQCDLVLIDEDGTGDVILVDVKAISLRTKNGYKVNRTPTKKQKELDENNKKMLSVLKKYDPTPKFLGLLNFNIDNG